MSMLCLYYITVFISHKGELILCLHALEFPVIMKCKQRMSNDIYLKRCKLGLYGYYCILVGTPTLTSESDLDLRL